MDRVAVFVDAGYVFAAGSQLVTGRTLKRGEIGFDAKKAIAAFALFAEEISSLPLLRIYWYDGTATGPTAQHLSLAYQAGVKVRLGFVNSSGEQKGVDSLIVTDMIDLARNGAMSDAVLVSGDEDLRVGVQQAQSYGVRVHLLGILPARRNQSQFLTQEADTTTEWTAETLASFLSDRRAEGEVSHVPVAATVPEPVVAEPEQPTPTPPMEDAEAPVAAPKLIAAPVDPADAFRRVSDEIVSQLNQAEVEGLAANAASGSVPRSIDGMLLRRASGLLGVPLEPGQKRELRAMFFDACRRRLKTAEAGQESVEAAPTASSQPPA